jgi:hypothetical protein
MADWVVKEVLTTKIPFSIEEYNNKRFINRCRTRCH